MAPAPRSDRWAPDCASGPGTDYPAGSPTLWQTRNRFLQKTVRYRVVAVRAVRKLVNSNSGKGKTRQWPAGVFPVFLRGWHLNATFRQPLAPGSPTIELAHYPLPHLHTSALQCGLECRTNAVGESPLFCWI